MSIISDIGSIVGIQSKAGVISLLAGGVVIIGLIFGGIIWMSGDDETTASLNKIITVHDGDTERTIVTQADTVAAALLDAEIETSDADVIEPSRDVVIDQPSLSITVYRARPIIVQDDGQSTARVVTMAQSPAAIAAVAGVTLYPEDRTTLTPIRDIVASGGAGLELDITRANIVHLTLYDTATDVRTLARTVGELLDEKGISLGADDRSSLPMDTPITDQMELEIWREGIQTITVDEAIPFETEQVRDLNFEIGYQAVQTAGVDGRRSVVYEVEIRNGEEISRREIQSVVTSQPTKQIEIIGAKPRPGGLTKAMGVNQFTDSRGVVHRETYYDLPMNVVMQNCGQGGYYTVRSDGVKVDRDGFVIIAANLARYPRCSAIETSLGPGKVYDTGGFAARYPDGWDIATDWTNYNGI